MANSNTAAKGEKGDVGLCGRIAEGKASIGKSTAATTATLCVKGVNIFYPKGSKTSSIFFYYHLISHSLSQPRVQSGNRKKVLMRNFGNIVLVQDLCSQASLTLIRIRRETEIGLDPCY